MKLPVIEAVRASADASARRLTGGARPRSPWEHGILGRHPARAGVAPKRRYPFLNARGANHFGIANFDEDGTLGIFVKAARDPDWP